MNRNERVFVSVNSADIRAEVPRTLYGTCLEDVNHEIYGGLDAQRLYDESFEETQPFAPLPHDIEGASGKVCGRQWTEVASDGGAAALDDAVAHWGRRSQRLSPDGGTAGVANGGLNGWGIPCRAGKRMVGHFFVKGRVDRLEVALQSRDGGMTYARQDAAPFGRDAPMARPCGNGRFVETSLPALWREVEFSLVPSATDPAARFLIAASGTGTVWIDDAYLADEPTNEFGRMGCREDIVAALQREGVTFLRWGGSMVNARQATPLFGPLLVERRKSTRGRGRREPFILQAVDTIRREACDGLTPDAVIRRSQVSKRLFTLRFREAMGHSVHDEIMQVRLERVFSLLAETDTPIGAISDMCGFGSQIELRKVFRARTKMSMTEWRALRR